MDGDDPEDDGGKHGEGHAEVGMPDGWANIDPPLLGEIKLPPLLGPDDTRYIRFRSCVPGRICKP